jgi:Flp pilus assembly protein TadD
VTPSCKRAPSLASQIRSSLGDTRAADAKETFLDGVARRGEAYTGRRNCRRRAKDQDAIEFYRKAVTIDPKFGRAYGGLALSMTRLGRTEKRRRCGR